MVPHLPGMELSAGAGAAIFVVLQAGTKPATQFLNRQSTVSAESSVIAG
jgi:hypothetical protein